MKKVRKLEATPITKELLDRFSSKAYAAMMKHPYSPNTITQVRKKSVDKLLDDIQTTPQEKMLFIGRRVPLIGVPPEFPGVPPVAVPQQLLLSPYEIKDGMRSSLTIMEGLS